MKINRNNYELYVLDYLEGNLEERLFDEFIDFLQKNPDLKYELQVIGNFKLPAEEILFEGKEQLLREKYDLTDEFNQAAIAWNEGDLSEQEKAEFEAYLVTHPAMNKELALFEKTKLKDGENIIFLEKSRLYHAGQGRTILLWISRIAAVIAVTFLIYHFGGDVSFREHLHENQVAVTENEKEKRDLAVLPETSVKNLDPAQVSEENVVFAENSEFKSPVTKSLRESNKGRNEDELSAQVRVPVEIPEKISPRLAALHSGEIEYAVLMPIKTGEEIQQIASSEERLLGDVVREKTGLDKLSLQKVAQAGLSLVASISGEKFSYETNTEGQITELSFDSRLLAFSIPTNNDR